MLKKDIKEGMKVVPFQKTAGSGGELENSCHWIIAKTIKQPYLYVIGFRQWANCWALSDTADGCSGDFYNAEDFDLYIEPNTNKKEEIKMVKSTLEKELESLEEQVTKVKAKIEEKKASKKIVEHIATYHVDQEAISNGIQYIDKDKLKLKLEDVTKNTKYTIDYVRKGNRVICTFTNGQDIGKGMSKCDDEDEFDYFTGIFYAELRARSDFYKNVAENAIKRNNFMKSIGL